MINFYKSENGKVKQADVLENGIWINMINPDESEQQYITETLNIEHSFIMAALDEEESSHIDIDDDSDQRLIVIDVPIISKENNDYILYSTIPLAIIITKYNIITISTREINIINDILDNKHKNINIALKTRFVLQMLYRVAQAFLKYLKQIDKISSYVEIQLQKSMRNKELLQLMEIEKSLVYFSTSLKANEMTLQKILRGRTVKLYEEDKELLEDVLIEVKQAIEMCNIYRDILSGTMDAFASVISNNLNIVMKVLTSLTIILSIPNIITSFYGMNVDLPLFFGGSYLFPLVLSLICVVVTFIFLKKTKMM